MTHQSSRTLLTSPTAVLLYIVLADFVFHMLIAGNYGYFRDELYYIVAGERLSFGYVDFPPVIALLAALMNVIAGDALVSIHIIPALAGGVIVFLAGKIASEFGGGLKAQVLAAVAAMFSASFAVASIFSMDVLDMLWWTLLAYLLVRIIKHENRDPKLWLIFGVVAGIGLMTKLTMAFFLLSVLVAFLFVKRSYLMSVWVWIAAAIALAILSPYVAWNALNGWPTVDFFIHHGGLNGGGPISFLANQILIAGLLGLPLVIMGLYYFFRSKPGHPCALLGVAFLVLLILFTVTNAKPYFIMGAYPFSFAAGAVILERHRRVWSGYLVGVILVGILLAPVYAPVLPPQTFVKYYSGLTGAANGASAQQNAGQFPQYLGDRFGWETMTAAIASVYDQLPQSEKASACIFGANYGEASALTFLGKNGSLPPVISSHNNFYIWGPGDCGAVLITVGVNAAVLQKYYRNVTQVALVTCEYCMSNEDNLPVYVATSPLGSLQSIWPSIKTFG
jgi:hypothetical protein